MQSLCASHYYQDDQEDQEPDIVHLQVMSSTISDISLFFISEEAELWIQVCNFADDKNICSKVTINLTYLEP